LSPVVFFLDHPLPDLLKNNHLEDPALLLVKNVEDMGDIWKRLKD